MTVGILPRIVFKALLKYSPPDASAEILVLTSTERLSLDGRGGIQVQPRRFSFLVDTDQLAGLGPSRSTAIAMVMGTNTCKESSAGPADPVLDDLNDW
jgi:hypothetical protein